MKGYRMHTLEDGTRVRVVRHHGFKGCHECGHTGRRRRQHFVPFNRKEFEAMLDRLWAREQAAQAA